MKRDVLASLVYQLHEDTGALMPNVGGMTSHVGLPAQQYDALRGEVKKLVPESEQAALPPVASSDIALCYSVAEVYLFSGQLLAILNSLP